VGGEKKERGRFANRSAESFSMISWGQGNRERTASKAREKKGKIGKRGEPILITKSLSEHNNDRAGQLVEGGEAQPRSKKERENREINDTDPPMSGGGGRRRTGSNRWPREGVLPGQGEVSLPSCNFFDFLSRKPKGKKGQKQDRGRQQKKADKVSVPEPKSGGPGTEKEKKGEVEPGDVSSWQKERRVDIRQKKGSQTKEW